jgi:hypothetical protein
VKNVRLTLGICLLVVLGGFGGLTPLHAQCKVATTGIAAVTGGYTVALPPQIASAVPTNEPLRLVVRNAAGNVSSVAGPVRVLASGQIWIQTTQKFAFSPQQCPSDVVIQKASLGDFGCLSAEFGIGCFAKWCGGQSYCLPGDGPGGFSCTCV